ncbi:UvrD-helicase domain-containing protein [Photobacterium leiognathi]|uniref:UvrD-helicase domain-containing protein n=1 Tax=Photobacterium leiognathi TaxID=553611 RepID=UPI00273638D9|nr:UvrD-helicase domain-containing protein [Photobacterium leiognathi]
MKKSLEFKKNNVKSNSSILSNIKTGSRLAEINCKHSVKDINNQALMNNTLLSSVKLSSRLYNLVSRILDVNKFITVGDLLSSKDDFYGISNSDLFNIKSFCKKRLKKSEIQISEINKNKILIDSIFCKKTSKDEKNEQAIKDITNKVTSCPPYISRNSLLNSIVVSDELVEVKEQVELRLGLYPTIDDFLSAEMSLFSCVDKASVGALKEFYQAGLIEESNEDKLTGKEAFYKLSNEKFAIVDAPPGCGKTHSIINKLDSHLAQIEQFYDARKVLVLSFTRNAVNELTQRIADFRSSSAQKNIDLVRVMTFDAFAYRVLSDCTDIGPSDDFDANITKVKALLIDGYKGGSSLIDELRWIYIDEYQDLVGCRADLVIELTKLVKRRKGAVSLLGDPCQQIMNFQLKKGSSKTTNEKFKFEFEKLAASKLVKVELTESYRFKTKEQRVRVEQLRAQMLGLGSSIDGRDFAGFVGLANVQEGSALLCSRNIDCLLAKRLLTKAGKKVHINQGSDRITVPSWLFDVFKGWKQTSMSRSTFIQRCQHNVCSSGEKEWKYLEKLGACDADKVKVELLVRIVEERGGVTSDLDSRTIMISTVHKAKGLQYPQVIYQTDEHIFEKKSESLNEFYVAVTRAQEKFSFLEKNRWPKLKKNRAKALYKHEGSYFLEGVREIELKSFFPDASSLCSSDMEFLMSSEAKFKVTYIEGKAFVVSTLPNGKQVKIYRLPRLEYCRELKGPSYVPKEVVPDHFATFVYVGESPRLENILGPTCFIKVPVFEGFWNAKDL